MNRYAEMNNRHQKEVDAFPIKAAFTSKQFREMMESWGFDPEKDTDKIYRLGSTGCFYRRTDADALHSMFARHEKELSEAIEADADGTGFIYEMFLYELKNHEFGYTGDFEDTLDALGYTYEEVMNDERLSAGLLKAAQIIMYGEED